MGFLSKFAQLLGLKKKEANIIVVGLDNSGKSTILNHLKPNEARAVDVVPTVGFNVEKLQTKSLTINAFDMSGQGRYRNLWEHYYKECDGIIFVVDSSDKLRMSVAKDELDMLLQNNELDGKRIPILFFANKMDARDAFSSVRVSTCMKLEQIKSKPWHICATNGLTGEGIEAGVSWLTDQVKDIVEGRK